MNEITLTIERIQQFKTHLQREEKSKATVEKYVRDVRLFHSYIGQQPISKEWVIEFKAWLGKQDYTVGSINSMLASLNSLLDFLSLSCCKTKSLRQQAKTYCPEEKELSKDEYMRLLKAAENNLQLHLALQTICGTGIRVSELQHFTVEAVAQGEITIQCKSKTRQILVPGKLRKKLLAYAKKLGIATGSIFLAKSGKPLSRTYIWAQMKRLCRAARVAPSKVFPHNLRKLFAKTFYKAQKDIAKLADIFGHSSINTTRIYIMSSGSEHRRKIEQLGLVL